MNTRKKSVRLCKERRKLRKMKKENDLKENDLEVLAEARFFYDLALGSYMQSHASNNLLNQKIHNMLALTGSVTLILIGLLYRVLFDVSRLIGEGMYQIIALLVVLGLVSLFISILLGIYSYKSWKFKSLNLVTFTKDFYGAGLLNALEHAISELNDMTEKNDKRIDRKAFFYHTTLWFVVIGIFLLIVGFVLLIRIN